MSSGNGHSKVNVNPLDRSFTLTLSYSALSKQTEMKIDNPLLATDPLAILDFLFQAIPGLMAAEFQYREKRQEAIIKQYEAEKSFISRIAKV